MWQQVLYGLTFMVFMRFLPDGVTPLCASAWRALAGRLGRPATDPPAGERAPDPRSGG
jgi:hypothetical protein